MNNFKEIRVRTEELWRIRREFKKDFQGLTEFRAKVLKIGKISDSCKDGVEFKFVDSPDNYYLAKPEFVQKFEKIY